MRISNQQVMKYLNHILKYCIIFFVVSSFMQDRRLVCDDCKVEDKVDAFFKK